MTRLEKLITDKNTLWDDEEGRLFMIRYCLDLLSYEQHSIKMLEIGVDRGSVPMFLWSFLQGDPIHRRYTGVDPKWRMPFPLEELCDFASFIQATSETFWQMDDTLYDLIYVDGCHDDDVAALDVREAVKRLTPNGILLVHDTRADGGPRRAFTNECLGNPMMTGFLNDYENVCRTGMAVGFRKGSVWD